MPPAEVDLDEAVVRRLLRAQHPDLADQPLELVANGWDNAVYRLGDDLSVRLPRRAMAAQLVANELRWLPELVPRLPLPSASPVRAGAPGDGYPFPWSVCTWMAGRTALERPPIDAAWRLGTFVAAMSEPAPPEAPHNPFRGVPLAERVERFEQHLLVLAPRVDVAAVRAAWADALATRPHHGLPRWLHGDLHPGNLVVDGAGQLSGVIDFGDLCGGDPATDLGVAWMMFGPEERLAFRAAAGVVDDDTWARGRGWALAVGVAILANSGDNPAYDALGARTVAAVLADLADLRSDAGLERN